MAAKIHAKVVAFVLQHRRLIPRLVVHDLRLGGLHFLVRGEQVLLPVGGALALRIRRLQQPLQVLPQGGAIVTQTVERAHADQRLDHLAVDRTRIGAGHEVDEVLIRTAALAFGDDRVDRAGADVLDAAQAEEDAAAGDAEVARRRVDGRRQDLQRQVARLGHVLGQLVGVVHFVGEVRGHELGREVRLQVRRAVGHHRIRRRVRLGEAVLRERDQRLEQLRGDLAIEAIGDRPVDEARPLLLHLLHLLLAHGTPQQVGLSQAETGHGAGDLHYLLLIDDHAVGLAQDRLQLRDLVADRTPARLGVDELVDELHRTRPVERVERDQILDAGWLHARQDGAHARAFELEHAG